MINLTTIKPGIIKILKRIIIHGAREVTAQISEWCSLNGLLLNTAKSQMLNFATKNASIDKSYLVKMNNETIHQVNHTKFLGVDIDNKLTWNHHIDSVKLKLSKHIYLLRQLRQTVSFDVLKLLYHSLIQSVIAYGLEQWGLSAKAPEVFIVQKKAIRIMAGASPRDHCRPLFIHYNLLTMPSLYIYLTLIYIRNNVSSLAKNEQIHDYFTRNSTQLHLPRSRLAVSQNHPMYYGVKLYNNLSEEMKSSSNIIVFKRQLKSFLLQKAYYTVDEFLQES